MRLKSQYEATDNSLSELRTKRRQKGFDLADAMLQFVLATLQQLLEPWKSAGGSTLILGFIV